MSRRGGEIFPDRNDQIVQMAASGQTAKAIGLRYGLTRHGVYSVLRSRGYRRAKVPKEPKLMRPPPDPVELPRRGDPCMTDRPYEDDEALFLRECEAYRQRQAVKFLAATDYLRVAKGMGYARRINQPGNR